MIRIDELARRLSERLREEVFMKLLKGLERTAEYGDPCLAYLEVSYIEPGYYGSELTYPWDRRYYKEYPTTNIVHLPRPRSKSGVDTLEALRSRRSRREYTKEPLLLDEIATILYYTAGITGRAWWGGPKRVYPSAGALQPIEVYLVASRVLGLEPGIYHYNPGRHALERLKAGDYSSELAKAALEQDHVAAAPASVILTAVYVRTASKYGMRSCRYIHMDAGFAGENLYIVTEALGLATVAVGAFYDRMVCKLLDIDCTTEIPMLIFPIGRRVQKEREERGYQ